MLGPEAYADKARWHTPQPRPDAQQLQRPRQCRASRTAERAADNAILYLHLQPLGGARGKYPALLHRGQIALQRRAAPERRRKNVGGSDGILYR